MFGSAPLGTRPLASASSGAALTLSLSDTTTTSDARTFAVGLAKTDTSTMSDAEARAAGMARGDTATMSDARAWASAMARTDAMTTSDALSRVWDAVLAAADTTTMTDSRSHVWAATLTPSDTATMSDARTWAAAMARADTATMTDFDGDSQASLGTVRDPTIVLRGRRGSWQETLGPVMTLLAGGSTRVVLTTDDTLVLTGRDVRLKIGLPVPVGSSDSATLSINVAMTVTSATSAYAIILDTVPSQPRVAGRRYAVVLADMGDLPCVHGRVA